VPIVEPTQSVDKFFAFDDCEPSAEANQPTADDKRTLSTKEKKDRIMSIYSKMARLEAFLNHTKQEIKKIERSSNDNTAGEMLAESLGGVGLGQDESNGDDR
jgi:hypothetical protein